MRADVDNRTLSEIAETKVLTHMFTSRRLIMIVLMVLSLPTAASANDASYFGRGASVFAYKENRIKMISEHIKISRTRDKSVTGHGWTADCTFVFENTENVPVTIRRAFD